MTRVVQVNLGKRVNASLELDSLLAQNKFDIALLQEPSAQDGKVNNLTGGSKFYKYSKERPRTCIWISKNLAEKSECILMNNFSNKDMTTIMMKLHLNKETFKELVISSIYCPHKDDTDKAIMNPINESISKLVYFCKKESKELILGGDTNSHHVLWGCDENNSRGEELLEFIILKEFEIINEGTKPTWSNNWTDPKAVRTIIDMTITTPGIKHKIKNWTVSNDITLSDHKAITYNIISEKLETTKYRNKKSTDWIGYEKALEKALNYKIKISNKNELEREANKLSNLLNKAYEDNCRLRINKERFDKLWLDKEILEKRKTQRKHFNKMFRSKKIEDIIKYKKIRKEYNDLCYKKKHESWKEMTNEIENIKDVSRLQKIFEKGPRKNMGTLKKADGTYTINLEESLTELMKTHFPGCEEELDNFNEEQMDNEIMELDEDSLKDIDEIVNKHNVESAIDSFKAYKAEGEDGIFPALLQKGKKHIMPHLINIFKASLRWAYIPKCWRSAKICFLPKPGKDNYDEPKSYRPISLMSFVLKTLEKLIDGRIREKNLSVNPLHKSQHAYQEGKGTESALHEITEAIENTLEQKEICLGIFIDIAGAFDNTPTDVMLEAARKKGIEEWIVRWLKSMLKTRRIRAANENCSKRFKPTKGCPQGGCLSPLLWLLVIDELILRLRALGIFVTAYADDLVIMVKGKYIKYLCDNMNKAMEIIEEWCRETGLTVNPAKTCLMRFTRKTAERFIRLTPIRIFGQEIELVEEVKYLGVHLDSKLQMNNHIKRTCEKALKSLWATRAMVKRTWGMNPKMMMWLYKQIILPRLTYGSVAWWSRAQIVTNASSLEKIQRYAMLMVTGAMKTTPSRALDTALNICPITTKVQTTAIAAYFRLKQSKLWRGNINKTNQGQLQKMGENLIRVNNVDQDKRYYNRHRNYDVRIREKEKWREGIKAHDRSIEWYSDGSRKDNKTASGIWCKELRTKINIRLSDWSTVMQAEITAIEMCAKISLERGIKGKEIFIHSDSQAALKALKKNIINSKTVENCAKQLNNLAKHNFVTINWVPGHKGIEGNELADKEANLGIDKPNIEKEIPAPRSEIKRIIRNYENKKTMKRWKSTEKLKHSKLMMDKPNRDREEYLLNLSRRDLRVAIGILTGSCCLKNFLKMIGKSNCDLCRFCGEEKETMLHILTECPAVKGKRARTLGTIAISGENIKEINIKEAMKFIKSIDIDKTFFREDE